MSGVGWSVIEKMVAETARLEYEQEDKADILKKIAEEYQIPTEGTGSDRSELRPALNVRK